MKSKTPKVIQKEIEAFIKENIRDLQSDSSSNALALIVDAWKNAPHKSISLWDMTSFTASEILTPLTLLKTNERDARENKAGIVDDNWSEALRAYAEQLQKGCEKLEMKTAASHAEQFRMALMVNPDCSCEALAMQIQSLCIAVECEFQSQQLILMPNNNLDLFEQEALFGAAVAGTFSIAAPDIKEAGNCAALGLNTAAVCLLMRVAEVGLRRLAALVNANIKHDFDFADWHELIEGIKKKLPPHGTFRNKDREEVERFYHAISADAEWLKTIRHEAMHARKPYGKAEADRIRARVEGFMQKLADDPPQLVISPGH